MVQELDKKQAEALRGVLSERHGEWLALTRELVEMESPSGDEEGSREVAGLLAAVSRGIEGVNNVERLKAENYGEHLRVTAFKDARGDDSLLIVGHTDTVHPRGSLRERPWREEGGRIYGPGIFDMKANCALVLLALRALSILDIVPRRPLELLLTCDEETGSMTGRALIEEAARRARCALVLEPPASGGRVKTARKGTGLFRINALGRAAHAGLEPEKGASAILEMARQIQRLHAMGDAARGTTINVGVVKGGTSSNVVAAEASAEVDVRFSTLAEARRVEQEMRGLEPFDERVRLSIEGGINRPPLERTEGVAGLYEEARRVAALLDFELGEASVGGASDGNFIAAQGTPALDGLGIEGDGAHAAHEHILVDGIAQRGALLAALIATL
jgi:glutamate carboxypeptidase